MTELYKAFILWLKNFTIHLVLLKGRFTDNKIVRQATFFVAGIAATLWFLSRVIPKPSRVYYPCMQAAAPVMAGFVIYLMSLSGGVLVFGKINKAISTRRYVYATALVFLLLGLVVVSFLSNKTEVVAHNYAQESDFIPNVPMGNPQGVNPGRVVWAWDHQAVNQNCQQKVNRNGVLDDGDDLWFMDKNTNQLYVDYLLSKSLQSLTGKNTDKESWDAMFNYFNEKKGRGKRGYQEGEIIFIKTNHGSAWGNDRFGNNFRFNDKAWNAGYTETAPQLVLAMLQHLVHRVGVRQENIYVGDPMKNIYMEYYQKWHVDFPSVNYLGNDLIPSNIPSLVANCRTPVVRTTDDVLFFSDSSDIPFAEHMGKLYTIFQQADYMINLSALKPHDVGGITAGAKNHFGSQASKTAGHLHGVLAAGRSEYGLYRVLVDIMGHNLLGRNTLFTIVDAMWSSHNSELELPVKWQMHPFNNAYPASLFISQDQVALESVCFDFLRTEYSVGNYSKNNPNMAATDDYLHQAADETNWPSGITYNPDGLGKIPSLGIHEHWNNATDMQYAGNFNQGSGIELYKIWVQGNRIPLAKAPIDEIVVLQENTDHIIVSDLSDLFFDVDGDALSFSVSCDDDRLICHLEGNTLFLRLLSLLNSEERIKGTLSVSDGKDSNSLDFYVSSNPATNILSANNKEKKIHIFPNPAKDQLTIRIKAYGQLSVRIINVSGKPKEEFLVEGPADVSLNVSKMKAGYYKVLLFNGNKILDSIGFIKQ